MEKIPKWEDQGGLKLIYQLTRNAVLVQRVDLTFHLYAYHPGSGWRHSLYLEVLPDRSIVYSSVKCPHCPRKRTIEKAKKILVPLLPFLGE